MKLWLSLRRTSFGYGPSGPIFNAAVAVLLLLLAAGTPHAQALPHIVVLGDSLTAGYGLPPEQAFPNVLQRKLKQAGIEARVQNAGVSGDTSAGGRARLDWALSEKPRFVILELGANDALRGVDPKETESNLDAILSDLKKRDIKVLLTGMLAPPNMGNDYMRDFNGLYRRLAGKHKVPLYPFFLDGVAGDAALNQPDGIHPSAKGVEIIAERILPMVKQLLAD